MFSTSKQFQRRKLLVDLAGRRCAECGSTERLEFDHVDPMTMTFRLSGPYLEYSMKRIMEEFKKCQLLCRQCHQGKSTKERGWSKSVHGTASHYSNRQCRCQPCKTAWATSQRRYREKCRLQRVVMA